MRLGTTTTFSAACRPGAFAHSADRPSAASSAVACGGVARQLDRAAQLAVDLHRHGHAVSSASSAGSASGQGAGDQHLSWPSGCHSSSARCGIIGPISSSQRLQRFAQRPGAGAAALPSAARSSALVSSRMRATATLKRNLVELLGHRRDRLVDGWRSAIRPPPAKPVGVPLPARRQSHRRRRPGARRG